MGKEARQKDAPEGMGSSCEDAATRCCGVVAARCLRSLQSLARHPAAIFTAASGILLMSTVAFLPLLFL